MWRFCFALFFFSGLLCGTSDSIRDAFDDQTDLSLEELHGMVDRLVDHHLGKQRVDASILKNSRENMFELFDKRKEYLLLDEVGAFVCDNDAIALLEQYNNGSFEVYAQILQTIRNSIFRSRKIRSGFFFTDLKSIELARAGFVQEYPSYAMTTGDLTERIFHQFLSYIVTRLPEGKEEDPEEVRKAVEVAEKEFEDAEKNWLAMSAVGEGERNTLFARMIFRSILIALDAHSDMLSASGAKATRERLSKESFGSGIICSVDRAGCRITKIVRGSPADRLGEVFVNDEISQIDGRNVSEMTREEIIDAFEDDMSDILSLTIGRANSEGKISIVHASIPKRRYTIEEGRLLSDLRSTPYGNILILNLYCFYRGRDGVSSLEDTKRSIDMAKIRGSLAGIILDLRDNGGGYITEAVRVVGLFIKTGVVMESVYSDGSCLVFRDVDPDQEFCGPIVILTSYATASAAEIVAQTLKDYGRAIVVGDPSTYGKGSIQMQTITDVTEKGAWVSIPMRMTIGNFYTVSGVSPQGVGVKADIVLPSYMTRKHVEEPICSSRKTVEPMFEDSLEDIKLQARGWYQEHYLPFLEHPTRNFRKYIPQLRRKSSVRIAKDPVFTLIQAKGTADFTNENIRQQVRKEQLEEAVSIMQNLLEEVSNKKEESSVLG